MASVDSLEKRLSVAEQVLGVGEPDEHYIMVYCLKGEETNATEQAVLTYCEENGVDPDDPRNSFLALLYYECEEEYYLPGDPNIPEGWMPGGEQYGSGSYIDEVKECAKSTRQLDGILATNRELKEQGVEPESYGYRRKR